MKITTAIGTFLLSSLLLGCASSSVVVGKVRPPIQASQVKLYLNPPRQFEEIALLESSSKASMSFSEQAKMDTVIARMKEEAAKLGANGVLLRGTQDQTTASIGTGAFGGNVALGTSLGITNKAGSGVAIYVTAE